MVNPGVERLGRYTVLRHFASGGMADVLLARADGIEGFERHLVLKRIRAEFASDKSFIKMFLDEARLAATLHHQNVVQVTDIGEVGGSYFFAMEYIHGEDLRTILHKVKKLAHHVPVGVVIAVGAQVAAGLHYAHERRAPDKSLLGIVHRDVSLSNVLVGYDGAVKVVDFGIARAASKNGTQSGRLGGKIPYMSPEQCRGQRVDRRSDVYALGVVLYEFASTTRLFKGGDYDMMSSIVRGEVPPLQDRRSDLPDALVSVIMRALAPDPDDRYQTAAELCMALDGVAEGIGGATSMAQVAEYLTGLFGDRVEPWLEPTTEIEMVVFDPDMAQGRAESSDEGARATPSNFDFKRPGVPQSRLRRSTEIVRRVARSRSAPIAIGVVVAVALVAFGISRLWNGDRTGVARRPAAAAVGETSPAPPIQPAVPGKVASPVVVAAATSHEPAAPKHDPATIPPTRTPPKGSRSAIEQRRPPRPVTRPQLPMVPKVPLAASPTVTVSPAPPPVISPPMVPTPSITSPALAAPPAPSLLAARVSSVEAHGSLSQAVVRRAVDRVAPAIQRCTATGAPRTVQVKFVIDDSRRAREVRGNAPACVTSALAGVRTESAPDVGEVEVTLQISLEATR